MILERLVVTSGISQKDREEESWEEQRHDEYLVGRMKRKGKSLEEAMSEVELDMTYVVSELVTDYQMYLLDIGFWDFNEFKSDRLAAAFEKKLRELSMEDLLGLQENGIFSMKELEKFRLT